MSSSPPEATEVHGAAVFVVATGQWQKLPGADVLARVRVAGDEETIAGPGFLYDLDTDTTTQIPSEDVLVYDEPMWTGTELVQLGWDCREGEYQGVGQVTAAAYNPEDGHWRTSPWPLPPPGREAIASVCTGEEVVACVDAADSACAEAGAVNQADCTVVEAWDPSTDAWGIRGTTAQLNSPVWDGTRILGIRGEHVVTVDPATLDAVGIAELPAEVLHLEPVWTGDLLVFFDRAHPRGGVWVDVAIGTVERIPPPPDAQRRNSDDGWVLRLR